MERDSRAGIRRDTRPPQRRREVERAGVVAEHHIALREERGEAGRVVLPVKSQAT